MAQKRLTKAARHLRTNMTDAERALWSRLRTRQISEAKFTRQFPIGDFIADFACRSLRLAIELDGGQHSAETDAGRTRIIEAHGYRVIRFWNHEVLGNIEGVLQVIAHEIEIARSL
ncbi:MAG: DUF559 domain-containing protein [Erythrobacter sp.]